MSRLSVALATLLVCCQMHGRAQSKPAPPCGMDPFPAWPVTGNPPLVKSWSKSELGRDWKPPACTGWTEPGFSTLVTTAARFHHTSAAPGLLRRIGAISELAGMRYWSTTHQDWRTLITRASALTARQSASRRPDFSPAEIETGGVEYFEQVDNLAGQATWKMHIAEASASRIVFGVENTGTVRYLLVPVLHPGDAQSVYFLDRESDDVWRFYSMVRTGKNANRLITGNEASSINRAVAFYRSLCGIPTAQEPPAAR